MLLVSHSSGARNGGSATTARRRGFFIKRLRFDLRVAIKFWHADCVCAPSSDCRPRGRPDRTRLRMCSAKNISLADRVTRSTTRIFFMLGR